MESNTVDAERRKQEAKAAGLLKKKEAQARRRQQQEEAAAKKKQDKMDENRRRQLEQEQKERAQAQLTTDGLDVQWNLRFPSAEGVDLYLDIWRDPQYNGQLLPAVLWLHGGGWKFGTHHTMPSFLRSLTSAGYAIVSVDYTKSGKAPFPACVNDCHFAVRWIHSKMGAEAGLDSQRVAVLGSSAGGHLAAMLGVTAGVVGAADTDTPDEPNGVSAVVAIAGPMDLAKSCTDHQSPTTPEAILLGAPVALCPSAVAMASPITHVSQAKQIPPFLLIHGDADDQVPIAQSEAFLEALCAAGAEADFIRIPNGNHPIFGETRVAGVGCLESAKSEWDKALNASIVEFLRRHAPPNR